MLSRYRSVHSAGDLQQENHVLQASKLVPDDVVRKFCKEWDRLMRKGEQRSVQLGRSGGFIGASRERLIKKYAALYKPE